MLIYPRPPTGPLREMRFERLRIDMSRWQVTAVLLPVPKFKSDIYHTGVLTPGRGGRLYLADTEELYERIEQISMRNKDLENALRRLQETVSDQPHPLLSAQDGVLQLNIIPQSSSSSGPSTSSSSKSPSASRISPAIHHPPPEPMELDISLDEDSNVIDAFGMLFYITFSQRFGFSTVAQVLWR